MNSKDYQAPVAPLKGEAVSESAGGDVSRYRLEPWAREGLDCDANGTLVNADDYDALASELSRLREREAVLVEALERVHDTEASPCLGVTACDICKALEAKP